MSRRLVILESPYAGDVQANVRYAQDCMRDSLRRGEAPLAPHLLYAQDGVLDDRVPNERELGMQAGFAWLAVADASVVYTDRGISEGMRAGIKLATAAGIRVEYRSIIGEGARR